MKLPAGISVATPEDVEELTRLVNKSYSGDGGKGWTNMTYLFGDIPRASDEQIEEYMKNPNTAFLKLTGDDNTIEGCLLLEDVGDRTFHLWCMAVEPSKQNQGIGRKILEAGVNYARLKNYKQIEFTANAGRPEIHAWYERRGFTRTGRILDFDLSSVIPDIKEKRMTREVEFVKYL